MRGKKSNQTRFTAGHGGKKKFEREIRDSSVIAKENRDEEDDDICEEEDDDGSAIGTISIGIYLWEFGQNDPKRFVMFLLCNNYSKVYGVQR